MHILTRSLIIGGGFRDSSLIQFSSSIMFVDADEGAGDLADHIKYCMVNNTILQYMHTVSPKLGFVRFIYFW